MICFKFKKKKISDGNILSQNCKDGLTRTFTKAMKHLNIFKEEKIRLLSLGTGKKKKVLKKKFNTYL